MLLSCGNELYYAYIYIYIEDWKEIPTIWSWFNSKQRLQTRYGVVSFLLPAHVYDASAIVWHPALPIVNLKMLCEMVGTWKSFLTRWTLVRLYSGVRPSVTWEFVWAGKPPLTSGPRASEGLLARVPPEMSLEMRWFGVHLLAPIECAVKCFVISVAFGRCCWFRRRVAPLCSVYVDLKGPWVEPRGHWVRCWRGHGEGRWRRNRKCNGIWFRGCHWRQKWRQSVIWWRRWFQRGVRGFVWVRKHFRSRFNTPVGVIVRSQSYRSCINVSTSVSVLPVPILIASDCDAFLVVHSAVLFVYGWQPREIIAKWWQVDTKDYEWWLLWLVPQLFCAFTQVLPASLCTVRSLSW